MTSYLSENGAKTYKMATAILLKFLTLEWNKARTIWLIVVSDRVMINVDVHQKLGR